MEYLHAKITMYISMYIDLLLIFIHIYHALLSDEPHISHTSKPNRNKSKILRLQFHHVYCWDIIVASVNLTIITGQIDFVITRTETWENPG